MANHLFFNTIYLQPLTIMDIIQAYAKWAKINEDDRQYREIVAIDSQGISKEIVEEFYIENKYILTSRILLDPTNPSIILLESIATVYDDTTSKVDDIKEDNDNYLTWNECIKLNAGRKFNSIVISEIPDRGPEEIITGGGSGVFFPEHVAQNFNEYFLDDPPILNMWAPLDTSSRYEAYIEEQGTVYKITIRDNTYKNQKSAITTGTHDSTYEALITIASYINGLGDYFNTITYTP